MIYTSDRIKALHAQLRLPTPDAAGYVYNTVPGHNGQPVACESEAGRMLRQIEDHLHIQPPTKAYLGLRLKHAEAQAANAINRPFNGRGAAAASSASSSNGITGGNMKFKIGDRVRYTGTFECLSPACVGQTGTVREDGVSSTYPGQQVLEIDWDNPDVKQGGVFSGNLELLSSDKLFPAGTRVRINSLLLPKYNGMTGVVYRRYGGGYEVRIDGETAVRFFTETSLELEKPMPSIANRVTTALGAFFGTAVPANVEQAARELAAATKITSLGESRKKRAKEALQRLGITLPEYRPGTVKCYESSTFRIEAITKEPSQRLDEARLRDELRAAGLSRARIDAAFLAARVANKAATSVVVTEL